MKAFSDIPDLSYLHIRLEVKSEYLQEALTEAYKTIALTHKEEGCLEYRLLHRGTSLLLSGKWKNKMSLDLHLLLQFHLKLVEEILPPLCKQITIETYSEVEPPITSLSLG